jgi:hypothetical protein
VSFYELLVAAPSARGPRGGTRLVLDDLRERWLTNGSFVEMVGRGFIGSRDANTATITDQVRAALDDGRSVTLAVGAPVRRRAGASP